MYFQTGQKKKQEIIRIIDDSIDDDGETVKVRIGNARLVDGDGNAVATLTITKAVATGTIRNAGAMPKAWLARFGRTVADQVLDAVDTRMAASRAPGTELSLAGQRVGAGTWAFESRTAQARLEAFSDRPRGMDDVADGRPPASRELSARDLLAGSSFAFSGETSGIGVGALWGRGAVSRFDGREGNVSLDGEVASAMVGADVTRGRTTVGFVVSNSRGKGGFRAGSRRERSRSPVGDGTVEGTLTGLYPWGRHALNDRLSVWGVVGYGAGELVLTPKERSSIVTDMDLAMAALGGRGGLAKPPAEGGFELAAKSDALMVRTASDPVSGGAGNLSAAEARVTRLRLGLKATWHGLDAGGGTFVPGVEIGVRRDGGDAETGFGADVGAGLSWTDPARGVMAEFRTRGLVTHEAGGFRERGLAGTLAWDPDPVSDRGPSLSLSGTMGAAASGGVDVLLRPDAARALGLADHEEDEPGRRGLEARLGYGIWLPGTRGVLTPYAGISLADDGYRIWRVGGQWNAGPAAALVLEGSRVRGSDAGAPAATVMLRARVGW